MDWIGDNVIAGHEELFTRVGCVGFGLGALYFSRYMHKLYRQHKTKADLYKSAPKYSDLNQLKEDILYNGQIATGTQVVLAGEVYQHADSVVKSQYIEKEGVAKRTATYKCFLVKNNKTGTYDEKENKVPDDCRSVPFQLVDQRGGSVLVEMVHNAVRFKQFLMLVHHRRIMSREPPSPLTGLRVQNGVRIEEHMLLAGMHLAMYGTVKVVEDEYSHDAGIVITPHEVNNSINALIYGNQLSSHVSMFLNVALWVGGCCLLIYGIYPVADMLGVKIGLFKSRK